MIGPAGTQWDPAEGVLSGGDVELGETAVRLHVVDQLGVRGFELRPFGLECVDDRLHGGRRFVVWRCGEQRLDRRSDRRRILAGHRRFNGDLRRAERLRFG